MSRRPPRTTRTAPLCPDMTLFRSHQRARAIACAATLAETPVRRWTQRVDAVVLHPVAGFLILLALMFVMFQAVYAWSEAPIGWIEDGIAALQVVAADALSSEEHTSELQSLMRISYAVFCLKK